MAYQAGKSKRVLYCAGALCAGLGGFALTPLAQAASELASGETVVLPEVQVSASSPGTDAPVKSLRRVTANGALGSTAEIDTPFSLKTVDARDIRERQASSIDEVLAGDSSVRQTAGAVVGVVSYVSVRGLLLDQVNGYKVDGLSYINRAELPLEMVDQVQVLKGLSGFMYGFGSPGGVVNYQLKRPTDNPVLDFGARYKSDGVFSESVDNGGRFGPEQRFGYRVNAVHEGGDTYVDGGHVRRDSGGLALDARLTDSFTWDFDALQSTRLAKGVYYGIFPGAGVSIPHTIPGDSKLAEDGSYFRTRTSLATTGFKWELSPEWTANVHYRYGEQYTGWREGSLNLLNNNGSYRIAQSAQLETFTSDQLQASLEGSFQTGPFYHKLVVGASSLDILQRRDANAASATINGGNLYDPVDLSGYSISTAGHNRHRFLNIDEDAAFVADTIDLTEQWSIIAGWRYTDFQQKNYDRNTGVQLVGAAGDYQEKKVTPTYALMYRPWKDTTIYTSYVESLEKGGVASISNSNYGEVFAPIESKQYELGIKTQGQGWNTTAALFQIDRGAQYTDSTNAFRQQGNVRYKGAELGGEVSLASEWTLSANALWLDSKYHAVPGLEGHNAAGVSDFQAASRIRYAPGALQGWAFSLGANYYSSYDFNAANTLKVDGYTLFDVGAQYQTRLFGKRTTLNAVVNNLTNEQYWVTYSSSSPSLMQGAPRNVALSLSVETF
ncbi:TonB-dependent siderophore receptor [Pseudomonas gingeri]